MSLTKVCNCCLLEQPFSLFSKKTSAKDGLQLKCKKCDKDYKSKWRSNNKERNSEYNRDWYSKNIDQQSKKAAENYLTKRDHILLVSSFWASKNRDKKNVAAARRRAAELKATPSWLTKKDILDIRSKYAMATWLTNTVMIPYHVDHVIPLCGKQVCGFHVPWNLSVVRGFDNLKKSNKLLEVN